MSDLKHMTRREWLRLSGLATIGAIAAACAPPAGTSQPPIAAAPKPQFGDVQTSTEAPINNPDEALQRLLEGNERFAAGTATGPNRTRDIRQLVAKGQHPWAAIWGCIDSRVSPELVFDRGLGDIFVIRTAGQVIDKASLGSLEFAVEEGVKLVMVLGHTSCGAIKAAIGALESGKDAEGNIGVLVEAIAPAWVNWQKSKQGDKFDITTRHNIANEIEQLKSSPIILHALQEGKIKLVGALYNLENGTVEPIL